MESSIWRWEHSEFVFSSELSQHGPQRLPPACYWFLRALPLLFSSFSSVGNHCFLQWLILIFVLSTFQFYVSSPVYLISPFEILGVVLFSCLDSDPASRWVVSDSHESTTLCTWLFPLYTLENQSSDKLIHLFFKVMDTHQDWLFSIPTLTSWDDG